LNRTMVASAERTELLADSSKFGVQALRSFADLAQIDILIVDEGLSARDRAAYGEHAGRLVIA
ncbi:hypothetical protein N5V57_23255, partial [Escherichia coli]|nr:hypothetical protein [Escherichia coli]